MADALTGMATAAAAAWGRLAAAPVLVQNRENAVFRLRFDDGRDCALRLHRSGYQSPEGAAAELRLMEALADAGFACPWPQRTRDGALMAGGAGARLVSVIQWIDAAPIGAGDRALDGRVADHQDTYRRLGMLLADLHLTADAVAPHDLRRPSWDAEAFCGPEPRWGRFWEHPALTAPEIDLLLVARTTARLRLESLPPEQWGVIHADVLQENVLDANGQLYLIDFDDCGFGPRLYDLATALIQHVDAPVYSELRDALVAGYLAGEGPLPRDAFDDLELFVLLRALASAGWIAGRAGPVDPRQAAYVSRAVSCARRFLRR